MFIGNFLRKGCSLPVLCCAVLLTAGCGGGGPERHEVSGKVFIDGRPAQRVMVQLNHQDSTIAGDDRYPVGLTEEDGSFSIGGRLGNPGVLPGSYRVTFAWLSSSGLDAVDKFGGSYSDAESSTYTLQVPHDGELVFELKSNTK